MCHVYKNISRKCLPVYIPLCILNEYNTIVLGVASKEGKEVIFKNPVSIALNPKINDWLVLIEKEIRFTWASLLNQAVLESNQF
jgi:dynein heavy chain 1, cytosolic